MEDMQNGAGTSDNTREPMHYICAIIKDEHLFLRHWIEYHLSIGFDEIHLYEDFTSKSHAGITAEYESVSLHSMRDVPGCLPYKVGRQVAVYNHFCRSHSDGWCLFADIDEYLRLELPLRELTRKFDGNVGICLWWKCYGCNGHVSRPALPVPDAYQNDFLGHWNPCWQFKSFVNLREAARHKGEQQHFINCHYHKRIVHLDGTKADFRQRYNKPHKSYDGAWIDHYISKSWEDYVARLVRGNITKGLRNVDTFFRMNPGMRPLRDELTRDLDETKFPTT